MHPHRNEFDPASFDVPPNFVNALLGRGWEDTSWHNDACPSFSLAQDAHRTLRLWIGRTGAGGQRFTLCRYEDNEQAATVWATDDLDEAMSRMLAQGDGEPFPRTARGGSLNRDPAVRARQRAVRTVEP